MNNEKYYKENIKQFIDSTINCDMSKQYNLFLNRIKHKGKILDVGFGSVRDLLYFKSLGYDVYGIDIIEEFIDFAREKGLNNVFKMDVLDINYKNMFVGIWCCASLLHLESKKLVDVLILLKEALVKDGIIYISFKYGNFEGIRNGRYFIDMTEEKIKPYLKLAKLKIVESYISNDVREGREEEKWLNLILKA